MNVQLVDIVGAVGAVASVSSFVPQAWKIIRERKTEGLSPGMYALTACAFACWMAFGFLQKQWAMVVPNAICLLACGFILVMIMLPQGKTADVAKAIDPKQE
ncbi:PQ-loop repeat-containing protein [Sandaracinobacteroides saxicola]|uniref:PQ-loop repeat-containing protein n=1 Tax=Sandaracinobacteroides saxicola TaxID=2759707 RepID=A0A7G5IMM7_9SPHN|nr:PQ-loop repeat-containing protein [Sandaracinobacteroides saxicola]